MPALTLDSHCQKFREDDQDSVRFGFLNDIAK